MIKRFCILFLTLLLCSSLLFSSITEKEVITVTYAADTASVIGFSTTAVHFATPVTNLTEVIFKADSSGRFITDEFYIYWQLYSTDKVRIRLTMESLTLNSSTLDYQVETYYELSGLRTDKNPEGYVIEDEIDDTITGFRMSSMPIALKLLSPETSIETGDYVGSMTLTLEVI